MGKYDAILAYAKATAADYIEDSRYQYRSGPHGLYICDHAGTWKGFYKKSTEGSFFVLTGFGFGDPPGEVYTTEFHQVCAHFEL